MATRSTIAVKDADGSVRSIYCHWDGYPEGVGATLREHYTNTPKIEQLLGVGDISVLGSTLDVYPREIYPRETDTGLTTWVHASVKEWRDDRARQWCEWGYLWDGVVGEWEVHTI